MNEITLTSDGSYTIYSEQFKETYHSVHGAVTESMHIFIEAGVRKCKNTMVNVLEIGFGTGLNSMLTMLEAERTQRKTIYHSIELFPLNTELYSKLNYSNALNINHSILNRLHEATWEKEVEITPYFTLKKIQADVTQFTFSGLYNLVYFDAFSPAQQPELWTDEIFNKLSSVLQPGAILVTYCARGHVRRSLQQAGFMVERLPGPPGKREMLRGTFK